MEFEKILARYPKSSFFEKRIVRISGFFVCDREDREGL